MKRNDNEWKYCVENCVKSQLKYATDSFDWLLREGAHEVNVMSIGLHLRIIGRPGRIWALEKFFEHVARARENPNGPWIASRLDIAEHFAGQSPFNPEVPG